MYEAEKYVVLFFIYGLAFFSMGILALQQNIYRHSHFPLLKSIKYLGCFGIIHGITEWVWMIKLMDIYPEYSSIFLILGTFLNALSFTFLWFFGIKLLDYNENMNKSVLKLPWIIFVFWIIKFIYLYIFNNGAFYRLYAIDDIVGRYFIGLPGSIVTFYALGKNANAMNKLGLKKIAAKLRGMAMLFLAYGVLAGAIVSKIQTFPANVLNKELFKIIFRFPVEIGRAIIAIGITILFVSIIEIFRLETKHKIARLSRQHATSQERRKLGHELHDTTIQNLFVTGLQVESLIELVDDISHKSNLLVIKKNLNETIVEIREFIHRINSQTIEENDLKERIEELVMDFENKYKLPIKYIYQVSDVYIGIIPSEKLTQLNYIIKEALNNVIKHSEATKVDVIVSSDLEYIKVSIIDDGKGFDYLVEIQKRSHYGLLSMDERVAIINGELSIDSNSKGTKVTITIPWEGMA